MIDTGVKATIIKRHFIILLIIFVRFIFVIWVATALYVIVALNKAEMSPDLIHFLAFPVIFLLINYAFVKLAFSLIEYNNNLIIYIRNKVILLKSTILLVDDVEIIDMKKIMKVDVECRGILANVIGYWDLVIEQQKNDVRMLHFVPFPYKALKMLEDTRDLVHQKKVDMNKEWEME